MRDEGTLLSIDSRRRSILSHLRSILLSILLFFISLVVKFPNVCTNYGKRKFGAQKKRHRLSQASASEFNRYDKNYVFFTAFAMAFISMSALCSMFAYTAADSVLGSKVMRKCVITKANSLS